MSGNANMNTFRTKVVQAIRICNEELEDRKQGIPGESTEDELDHIILPELNQLLVMIDDKQLPPKEERYLHSFAHAFTVWGWNMQRPTKLFVLLTELNNEFKKI